MSLLPELDDTDIEGYVAQACSRLGAVGASLDQFSKTGEGKK
jgi:hypothetical protein